MDRKAFVFALTAGTVLQLAMILAGHFAPVIRDQGFMLGGLTISLLAGLLYARRAGGGWAPSLLGGAIAGGVCALIGIAASVVLKDTPAQILLFGTLGSTVTGVLGGAIGMVLGRG